MTSLRFSEIAGHRTTSHADRDGYVYETSELMLRNGDSIALPMIVSPRDIATARSMLAGR